MELFCIVFFNVYSCILDLSFQSVFKSLIKLWKDIYHSFARLSALVSTAEPNTCLEETCSKVLSSWLPEFKVKKYVS